jgi:hypothetical protein
MDRRISSGSSEEQQSPRNALNATYRRMLYARIAALCPAGPPYETIRCGA